MKWWFHRQKQHPTRPDRSVTSLRRQAFEYFDSGYRPSRIYREKIADASPRTLFRYYEDWKKQNNRPSHSQLKKASERNPGLTEVRIKELSEQLGMPVAEILAWAEQPWAILQLLWEQLAGNPIEAVNALVEDIILLEDDSLMQIKKEQGAITITTRHGDGTITRGKLRCN